MEQVVGQLTLRMRVHVVNYSLTSSILVSTVADSDFNQLVLKSLLQFMYT